MSTFRPSSRRSRQPGYAGDVEVEIFNAEVWAADCDEVLAVMKDRYLDRVLARQ